MDTELPCFSFRANWQEGVIERLTFLSTVLRAEAGAEQRQAVRLTPRRTLEADFLLSGRERAFYDVFMHNLGGVEITVPLYWDVVPLPHGTVAGNTTRLDFDTRWTEFRDARAIIIQSNTAFDYETIMVESVDDNGLELVTATTRSWTKGVRVMPLQRAYIEDMGDLGHPSADVGQVTVSFLVKDDNPWTPLADLSTVYLGLPVYEQEPNWADTLSTQFARDAVRYDPQVGLPYQTDPVGRANVGQAHSYFLAGREELASFRDLVYRHQGRRGAFWLPTFKRDLELRNSPGAGAVAIEVDKIGLQYVGGPGNGREHIIIWTRTGQKIVRKITSATPGSSQDRETLGLDAPLGLALSPGLVRKISFLDTGRFDQDQFEIKHPTSSTGLSEVQSTFRTFKNTRNPAGVISFPIPAAEELAGVCGIDVESNCYEVPFIPVFVGWYAKAYVKWYDTNATYPGIYVAPDTGPTIFGSTNGVWPGTTSVDFPAGIPYRVWDLDGQGMTVYYCNPAVEGATTADLRLQFNSGSHPGHNLENAEFTWTRWANEFSGPIAPFAGDSGGTPFLIGQLFPQNWYFNI